jgi:hypothetical protein
MTNVVRYNGEAGRGPSPDVWAGVNLDQLRDWFDGFLFEDDFTQDHDLTNRYTATQATAGTFLITDAEGGVADADCNSTTATQGINVQAASTVGERFRPQADDVLIFEARLKAADIATGPEFFVGLSVIDTTIIAASANSSANHIGFESVTDDNVLLFHSESGGTRSSTTTPHTLVDDTFVKLGFRVKGTEKIEVFVDGVKFGETIETNIPTELMVPSLVCQSGGTTDPIVSLDWWRCAQIVGS